MKKEKTSLADELKLKSPKALLCGVEGEQIVEMNLQELVSFTNHPFKVLEDESMTELMESIAQFGVATPIIVRPKGLGSFEIVAGHRRTKACELLGLATVPAVIRELDDEEATLFMVDTNIQREMLLPSEKAFAYKMKLEAIKRKAGRPKNNSPQVGADLRRGDEVVGETVGESKNQIQRYVRLTYLIPNFLDLVDTKRFPFNVGVELSYLTHQEQGDVEITMERLGMTPSLEQATKLKKYSKEGGLTEALIDSILTENTEKAVKTSYKLDTSKFFPKDTPKKEIEATINQLLEQWFSKNQDLT